MPPMLITRVSIYGTAGVASIILMIAVGAPLGNGLLGYPSGEGLYQALNRICHQFPLLSFWLVDHPMALCARCTGGYSGVVLGALVFSAWRKKASNLEIYAATLTIFFIAVLEAIIHISDNNIWRFSSGLFGGFGSVCCFICIVHYFEILINNKVRKLQ